MAQTMLCCLANWKPERIQYTHIHKSGVFMRRALLPPLRAAMYVYMHSSLSVTIKEGGGGGSA